MITLFIVGGVVVLGGISTITMAYLYFKTASENKELNRVLNEYLDLMEPIENDEISYATEADVEDVKFGGF